MKAKLLGLLKTYGLTVIGLCLLAAAVWVVKEKFGNLRLSEIKGAMDAFPMRSIVLAGMWTVLAYIILTFYDLLATRYVKHPVSYPRVALAACCAYTFAHNLGFATVSGAATRYRLYAQWGLTPLQIAGVVAFCSLTFGLGAMVLGGFVMFTNAADIPMFRELPTWLCYLIGAGLWAGAAAYICISMFWRRPLRGFGGELMLPDVKMASAQVLLATVDLAATALIFWALLPEAPGLTYWHFLGVYLFAYSAGLAAHLPGGIGVFDTAMAVGLSPWLPAPVIFAAIIIFRLWYYLIPMAIAGIAFAAHELRGVRRFAVSVDPFVVPILSGFTALAGAVLLFEGARGGHDTLTSSWLLQLSKLGASLTGGALLLLAWGLLRRVTMAWISVEVLLVVGAVLAVVKGVDWFIPATLLGMALLLWPFRGSFYRDTQLKNEPFSLGGIVPLLAVLVCSVGLALFTHRQLTAKAQAWWEIPFHPEAPLELQASIVLGALVLLLALWRMLRPAHVEVLPFDAAARADLATRRISLPPEIANSDVECIVWGEARKAALVYRRYSNIWVAVGDPVGDEADRVSAIWRFRDLCEQQGVDPAIWLAGPRYLKVYGDIGLSSFALGSDGQPLPELRTDTPATNWYLVCEAERDLTTLLPVLPRL